MECLESRLIFLTYKMYGTEVEAEFWKECIMVNVLLAHSVGKY